MGLLNIRHTEAPDNNSNGQLKGHTYPRLGLSRFNSATAPRGSTIVVQENLLRQILRQELKAALAEAQPRGGWIQDLWAALKKLITGGSYEQGQCDG
jgi:hypothetical protein